MRTHAMYLGILLAAGSGCATGDNLRDDDQESQAVMEVTVAIKHDISAPLRDLVPFMPPAHRSEREFRRIPLAGREIDDPIAQVAPGPEASVTSGLNFAGV